jgi:hypothetical protein
MKTPGKGRLSACEQAEMVLIKAAAVQMQSAEMVLIKAAAVQMQSAVIGL